MSRFLDELRALIAHPDVNDVRVYAFEDSVVLDGGEHDYYRCRSSRRREARQHKPCQHQTNLT